MILVRDIRVSSVLSQDDFVCDMIGRGHRIARDWTVEDMETGLAMVVELRSAFSYHRLTDS